MTTIDHAEAHLPSDSAEGYPTIGETTQGLGRYLLEAGKLKNEEAFRRVRRDALSIVSRSRRFDGPDGQTTGLVVGYVQSGKTMSMAAVSSLARDNGCRIIVLLAGVTTNLLKQNADRFRKDLRAASGKSTAWRIFNSQDGLSGQDEQHLRQAVAEWQDPAFSDDRQTLLFLVLKHHAHLERLRSLLSKVSLKGVPALILDDEADQAGLNAKPDDPGGTITYQKIKQLRACLPHHTYLQYTATPQAPLLIALDDMLSPQFAELVEPGDGYTGGQTFFGTGGIDGIVRAIPADDLFKPGAPPDEIPDSLLDAMRVFFLGCAVAALRGGPTPRSMLVHPSPRTADHTRYVRWISEVIKRWSATLRSEDANERADALAEFMDAYADLAKTDSALPPFEELSQRLKVSLSRVSLKEVNSQDGSEIDWENADEHILVGGEKLNRGFTVEGLVVTYMPRDAGDWNADTIQQRARFFGYKEKYLPLCRLYLHKDVIRAYRSYVRHEEDIRRQLTKHRGKPLREWRRAFFLDAQMKPTRRSVLSDPFTRIERDSPWFLQRYPHDDVEAYQRNAGAVRQLESKSKFERDAKYFEHEVALSSLREVYQQLLVGYVMRETDRAAWYGQLVLIAGILDKVEDAKERTGNAEDAQVLIMRMRGQHGGARKRTKAKDESIALHQGRSSKEDPANYPGDAKMVADDLVTLQIHWLNIETVGEGIPAIALHVPKKFWEDDVIVSGSQ